MCFWLWGKWRVNGVKERRIRGTNTWIRQYKWQTHCALIHCPHGQLSPVNRTSRLHCSKPELNSAELHRTNCDIISSLNNSVTTLPYEAGTPYVKTNVYVDSEDQIDVKHEPGARSSLSKAPRVVVQKAAEGVPVAWTWVVLPALFRQTVPSVTDRPVGCEWHHHSGPATSVVAGDGRPESYAPYTSARASTIVTLHSRVAFLNLMECPGNPIERSCSVQIIRCYETKQRLIRPSQHHYNYSRVGLTMLSNTTLGSVPAHVW